MYICTIQFEFDICNCVLVATYSDSRKFTNHSQFLLSGWLIDKQMILVMHLKCSQVTWHVTCVILYVGLLPYLKVVHIMFITMSIVLFENILSGPLPTFVTELLQFATTTVKTSLTIKCITKWSFYCFSEQYWLLRTMSTHNIGPKYLYVTWFAETQHKAAC